MGPTIAAAQLISRIAHPDEEHPAFPNIRQPCQSRSRLELLEGLKASLKQAALMRGTRPAGLTRAALWPIAEHEVVTGPVAADAPGLLQADHLDCPPASSAGWLRPDKSRRPDASFIQSLRR